MPLLDFALPNPIPGTAYTVVGIVAAAIVIAKLSKRSKLDAFPTVGPSNVLESWWAGEKYPGTNIVQHVFEGYEKYNCGPFKVADRHCWVLVLSSREHVDEVRHGTNSTLSIKASGDDQMQTMYTVPEIFRTTYHSDIIRSELTRSIPTLYPEIRDEIITSFNDVLDLKDNEWKSIPALAAVRKIVPRTIHRIFVGLPLCRDPDWIDVNVRYARDLYMGAMVVRMFPRFLASFATHYVTPITRTRNRAIALLSPVIEEELRLQKEYGNDRNGKPRTFLSWMIEQAQDPERTARSWTVRILVTNSAAIHSGSSSLYYALFFLAENPQYIQPLREEVESIVEKEGWSKVSIGKMNKIDSFLKECQRMSGMASVSLRRKAVTDVTFADGTHIPKGTLVAVPAQCFHLDDEYYENAHVFNPWRFSDLRKEHDNTKYQFVATGREYLPFGHGRHACPGRFFAVTVLKTQLAHVVMSYDLKIEDNKTQSKGHLMGFSLVPNPDAKIMFRRRVR